MVTPFTQQFIVCHRQTRPLILGQDFSICYHAGCSWTDYGTKRFTTRGRLIMEIEEPETSKYLPVQKSIKIPPRHYAVTHLYCKKPKGPVSIKPDQAFRRDNPSAWIDTYYMGPRCDQTTASTASTAGPQVHDIEINEVGSESIHGPNGSDMDSDMLPPGPLQKPAPKEGADFEATPINLPQVSLKEDLSLNTLDEKETMSSDKTLMQDKSDTSGKSKQEFIKIPYVIYNLDAHNHVYISKGTVVGYTDNEEPEMECFRIAETFEEAQEAIQYRDHLPNHPKLPIPPQSDLICSPAEVKLHRRVELKDHDATEETKKHFEELCQQFPEVFSTNNEDIGRTNLITIEIDTGDSPPSAKKPYTLPLKHYEWIQQEIESLERAGIITRSVSPWASPVVMVPKKSAPGEAPRRRMCIDFHAINALQPTVVKADSKAKGNFTLHTLLHLM